LWKTGTTGVVRERARSGPTYYLWWSSSRSPPLLGKPQACSAVSNVPRLKEDDAGLLECGLDGLQRFVARVCDATLDILD